MNSRQKILQAAARLFLVILLAGHCFSQRKEITWTASEKPLAEQIHGLRGLPDDVRSRTTKDLALNIRVLPSTDNKLRLAVGLANLSTEGDFGHDTLQEVAATLSAALKEHPLPSDEKKGPAEPYVELASLVRYEHVDASLDDAEYRAAMARLEADDRKREQADFSLKDLTRKTWRLSDLKGKVVVVNFWATWCPPCRKEMPDLQALYDRFAAQNMVILAISDEEIEKVQPFIHERGVTFPVLLDPGRKANEAFVVEGIPKTFVFDRNGKLVAQSIDMRTRGQFLAMLKKAGIE
jgi:peroxiredoxin